MHDIPASGAAAALRAAEAARDAAARPGGALPAWYPAANGGLMAAGLTLIGSRWIAADSWPSVALLLVGALLVAAQIVLAHRVEHRPGIIHAYPRHVGRRQVTLTYAGVLFVVAGAGALFGLAGLFIVGGVGGGLANGWLLSQERAGDARP
ncbi:hypothetical protein [Streptomyces sp. NL15-2K]|uniref:hypothetical protein n=1 Tax=Streptomyces sp. NL15-2K TaxID=376149 RepID=UPI000F560806|nr:MULTISPECIES: hypothetical protein [Actinomycetes]WKX10907.1 hypothetical protein Q4V64_26740 [Kutzneria buriramensis]GCB47530.1 hypothetical protein SNL152K_4835 [Streptomyces sp. NL15-2K]